MEPLLTLGNSGLFACDRSQRFATQEGRKRRVAKSSLLKTVHSFEIHGGAFEVAMRSCSPPKDSGLLLMQLRVSVAASTGPTLLSTTVPTLSDSGRGRVGEVELDRKAAGDSTGSEPFSLESSGAPQKGQKVRLQALNSAEEPWDPRILRAQLLRISSDSVVVAPTRLNAQDSEGAPSLAAGEGGGTSGLTLLASLVM